MVRTAANAQMLARGNRSASTQAQPSKVEPRVTTSCSGRSETDPPAALKLTHLAARFHTGSATVTEPLEVDFLSAAAFRRWR
jgi:hypothetical protein